MKWLTIILMKYQLKKAIKKYHKENNSIVKNAYKHMIKSYDTTLLFLK